MTGAVFVLPDVGGGPPLADRFLVLRTFHHVCRAHSSLGGEPFESFRPWLANISAKAFQFGRPAVFTASSKISKFSHIHNQRLLRRDIAASRTMDAEIEGRGGVVGISLPYRRAYQASTVPSRVRRSSVDSGRVSVAVTGRSGSVTCSHIDVMHPSGCEQARG